MKIFSSCIFLLVLVLFISNCREEYEPLEVTRNNNFLVVEGFINTSGNTTIKLSRTVKLTDSTRVKSEIGASVSVEGQNNNVFMLQDAGNGTYTASNISLPVGSLCRLRIKTQAGKEYVSANVPIKSTPAIDSITWIRASDGVHTYVNTHDPLNNTKYYLWEYEEDWVFRSKYQSVLEYQNGIFVNRDPSINIFTCWSSEKSSRVISGTTANLSNDIIKTLPITFIPMGSWKLSEKYSLLVKQYPLTKEGFQFWENVKKISEQLGTIFDPMPSQVSGNIHCVTSPEETVLGFISAGSTVEKRIYITYAEVAPWLVGTDCTEKFVSIDSIRYYFGSGGLVPLYYQFMPPGYPASTLGCIDCRLWGSNIKPAFWQ